MSGGSQNVSHLLPLNLENIRRINRVLIRFSDCSMCLGIHETNKLYQPLDVGVASRDERRLLLDEDSSLEFVAEIVSGVTSQNGLVVPIPSMSSGEYNTFIKQKFGEIGIGITSIKRELPPELNIPLHFGLVFQTIEHLTGRNFSRYEKKRVNVLFIGE